MKITRLGTFTALGATASLALAVFAAGCQTSHTAGPNSQAKAEVNDTGKGGAQLWAENCVRCHNNRSPSTYSDAEWDVAMHHMRIRANLTAEEHRKILQFLKSAN